MLHHLIYPFIAYFEEDAQEIDNNGLKSHSDEKNSHESWTCDQARKEIILIINTTRADLIEDLKEKCKCPATEVTLRLATIKGIADEV